MENSGKITFELAGTSQRDLLHQVATKAYLDHFSDLWIDQGNWYVKEAFGMDRLSDELANPSSKFILACRDHIPVGFLHLQLDKWWPSASATNDAQLKRIYLVHSSLGMGLGQRLMDLAVELARSNDKKSLWLQAMACSKQSIRFYRRNGFAICGRQSLNLPLVKPGLEGMVIMRKPLG